MPRTTEDPVLILVEIQQRLLPSIATLQSPCFRYITHNVAPRKLSAG